MGTLSSELGPHVERLSGRPRIYADANVPSGLVAFMRTELGWDVLFVIEQDDLRRARDEAHYRLAAQLRRTLVTLDRDYLDDRKFPPADGAGLLVLSAADERGLRQLVRRLDRFLFDLLRQRVASGAGLGDDSTLPLSGRKVHAHPDWSGPGA